VHLWYLSDAQVLSTDTEAEAFGAEDIMLIQSDKTRKRLKNTYDINLKTMQLQMKRMVANLQTRLRVAEKAGKKGSRLSGCPR